jgi:hypothetical protein
MSKAKARPTGLGMESDGKELSEEELPEINEDYLKVYPMVNITLHFFLKKKFIHPPLLLVVEKPCYQQDSPPSPPCRSPRPYH